MDATYRSDLRDLNELNFARFDAKLEQRLAEFEAKLERRLAEFRTELVAMFDQRLSSIEARVTRLDVEIQVLRSELRADAKSMETRLVKWMFLFWAGTALAGLLLR